MSIDLHVKVREYIGSRGYCTGFSVDGNTIYLTWEDEDTYEYQARFYIGPVVVTRHPALIDYLRSIGMIGYGDTCDIIDHATVDDIKDRNVIGILPPSLAKHAKKVTEIPMDLPMELRGKELTLEQVEQYAGEPWTYTVREVT